MKRSFYPKTKFAVLVTGLVSLLLLCSRQANAAAYYVVDSNPWGFTYNNSNMDAVFGSGNWTQGNSSTPAATIFAPGVNFVFLEAGDGNSTMATFISNNITTIENWVAAGGRLFMNAAPNYGGNQSWGFGGTTLNYPSFAGTVTTSVPSHQIFTGPATPTATTMSGNSYAHAYISGTGLTSLLYDVAFAPDANPVLCYKTWGSGIVFFGGITQPWFHSPQAEAINVWQNILFYVNNYPLQGIHVQLPGNVFCPGAVITVNFTTTLLNFHPGNVYTVQLSNAVGSFASPLTLGTLTSTATSGSITVTLPFATGNGYRIRIVSTDTAYTGADNGVNIIIGQQIPDITITSSASGFVCTGTSVTFNAHTQFPGISPNFQWFVNGFPVGNNDSTYITNTLNMGDQVKCVINTTSPCVGPQTDTSNSIMALITPAPNNLAGFIGTTETQVAVVNGPQDIRYENDCDLMVSIKPSNPNPYYGQYEADVTIDTAVFTFNGQPYVERHFSINPYYPDEVGPDPESLTAHITLYAYQHEFDNYNFAAGPLGEPLLPTGGVDNGNVRVTQFHGFGTYPEDFDVPGELVIPNVSWDPTHNWWQIDFDVHGFSAFFIHTALGPNPLAISIADIRAANAGQRNRVDWRTASEQTGDVMTLERSKDGKAFATLANIAGKGAASNYTYWDEKPYAGVNYYRLKVTGADRSVSYSNVVTATVTTGNAFTVRAYPNPVNDVLTVTLSGERAANSNIIVTDMIGRTVATLNCDSDKMTIDMSGLAHGTYIVKYTDDAHSEIVKVNKQ
ncbi:MAG: T9SS type A sorting domain-containing protein [Bacteroidetes bacterium]|nr:T9SS type A sorting domain-containing protein [Bacteroidota bacterium]